MKKFLKIYVLVTIFLFLISVMPALAVCATSTGKDTVTGQYCYTPLEPAAFPGVPQTGNLTIFLSSVFSFGIAIAVVLALIMIIWGGIMYMTTDSWTGKEDGKTKIKDALYGLGLALVSYLILYTINPCLVQYIYKSGNACQTTNTFLVTP